MELQWLAGALVDDGLLDRMAYLEGEFVGSEYAFLQGNVFFIRRNKCYLPRIIVRIFVDFE